MLSYINKIILKSLASGDKYGLEIIKDVEEYTHGKVKLKQPSLYSALRRMEQRGYITSFWEDSEIGGKRHYYSLSNLGKSELEKSDKQAIEEVNGFTDISPLDADAELEDDFKMAFKGNTHRQDEFSSISLNNAQNDDKIELEKFEKFNPSNLQTPRNSFTQDSKKYREPEKIVDTPPLSPTPIIQTPTYNNSSLGMDLNVNNIPKNPNQTQTYFKNNDSDVEFIESNEKPKWSDDINYKDILGDLDANNVNFEEKNQFIYHEPPKQMPYVNLQQEEKEKVHQKPKISKEIEEILFAPNKSTKESQETNKNYTPQSLNDTLSQINRRYNLMYGKSNSEKSADSVNNTQNIPYLNSETYKHLNKDKITEKPYSKEVFAKTVTDKNFVCINKFNLCRSIIMSILYLLEMFLAYVLVKNNNLLFESHTFLYWLAMGLVAVYIIVMLVITTQNMNKKIYIKSLNTWMNLFYRLIISVVLETLVIAICLCFGMSSLAEVEYFSLWLIPTIAILNILLSWLIGLIMKKLKLFRI